MARRTEERSFTISAAVSEAFSIAQAVREELEEAVSNIEGTPFENTERFERMSSAVDTLTDVEDEPEAPDSLPDATFTFQWPKRQLEQRERLSLAADLLRTAADEAREQIEIITDAIDPEGEEEHPADDIESEISDFADELEEIAETIENAYE